MLQLDIYQKLSNLQVELKKLQEAEQLLSNALSTKYLDLQAEGQWEMINVAINKETCHHYNCSTYLFSMKTTSDNYFLLFCVNLLTNNDETDNTNKSQL